MLRITKRRQSLTRLGLPLAAAIALVPQSASAQTPAAAEPQLLRRLDQRVSLAWSGQTLGTALERLSQTQQIPVWLDRRVDHRAEVELTAADQSLRQALSDLAKSRGLAAVPFRNVVYFGPRQTAEELATLSVRARESLAKAPPAARAHWLKATPWSFPRLSQPRALLDEAAAAAGAIVVDEHRVPHDLWPARTTPPLAVVDRVVLLLASFDLACEISPDGDELRVTGVHRPVEIVRRYGAGESRKAAFSDVLAQLKAESVRRRRSQLEISARWEDHERLRQAMRGQLPTSRATTPRAALAQNEGRQLFTLKIVNQPVDKVIDQLARQLELTVLWESRPAAGSGPLVSCEVAQVDLDGLLRAVLSPAGLTFDRDGQSVEIRSAP